MSSHDFKGTPSKEVIIERMTTMQKLGADIPKIAVMPSSPADVLTLLDATYTMYSTYADRPIITMAMAKAGIVSRMAGEILVQLLHLVQFSLLPLPDKLKLPS